MSRSKIDPSLTSVTTTTWKHRNHETTFQVGDLVTANTQSVQGVLYIIEGFKEEEGYGGKMRSDAYVRPVFSLWQAPISSRRPKWEICRNLVRYSLQDIAKDYADLGLFIRSEARRLSGKDDQHDSQAEEEQQQAGGAEALSPGGDDHPLAQEA